MSRFAGKVLALVAIAMIAHFAYAREGQEAPKLTPEQQAEMEAYVKAGTPGAPHEALASFAGTYEVKVKSWPEAGAKPMEDTGSATRKMILDGRVMLEEYQGSMMGTPFTGRGMTGYDNVSGKYWATWIDSMSTGLMVSEGTCASPARNCTFKGTFNDPIKKGPVTLRVTTYWPESDTEVFEMYAPGKDGKEFKMMEMTYRKQ